MTSPVEPAVTLVIETDSVHPYDDISIDQCLRAIASLDYPKDKIQYLIVNGGKVANIETLTRQILPAAKLLQLNGGTKFQQKNLGIRHSTGDLICFIDGDCATPQNWLKVIVEELSSAPENIAGVQGTTELTRKRLSREVSGLFYGVRTNSDSRYAQRLVTDNCAFRGDVLRKFRFEREHFSTVADTLLMMNLKRAGYRMYFSERLKMKHSFPGWNRDGLGWFFGRAYGVGYYMVLGRRLEKALRGSSLIRPLGLGWPVLAAGKAILDLKQLWQNRSRLQLSFVAALPLTVVYESVLFLGGCSAILYRQPPNWS